VGLSEDDQVKPLREPKTLLEVFLSSINILLFPR